MANYKLPSGQIIADTDPNIEEFKKGGATLVEEETPKSTFQFERSETPAEKAKKELLDLQQTDLPDESGLRYSAIESRKGLISGIQSRYDEKIRQAQRDTRGDLGRTRALSSITGTLGSPRGTAQREGVKEAGRNVESAINDEREFKLATIFADIDKSVEEKMKTQREQAIAGREAKVEFLEEQATKDRDLAASFIKNGGDPEVLNDEDYTKLRGLIPEMGDLEFDLFTKENKPTELQDTEITSKWDANGNFIRITQSPNGEVKTMTYTSEDLGTLTPDVVEPKFVDVGGIKYFYDANNIQIGEDGRPVLTPLGSTSKGTSVSAEEKKLNTEVSNLKKSLDDPDNPMKWGTAFDSIKTSYPFLQDEAINGLLGGSIEYNSSTGEFGIKKGRANQ